MVNFSKNWNNKLDWGIIPTWRLHTPERLEYYKKGIGGKHIIKLIGKQYCRAYLWQVTPPTRLKDIPNYMKVADTGLSPKEFDNLIESFYSKKPQWKGGDTELIGLFYIKDFGRNWRRPLL